MILVTGKTGDIDQHIVFHPQRTGAAVCLSTRGGNSAGLRGSVADGGEQRTDSINVRATVRLVS